MMGKPTLLEAKILVYLNQVPLTARNLSRMSLKLKKSYNYLAQVVGLMVEKRWLLRHKSRRKTYFELSSLAPLDEARQELMN